MPPPTPARPTLLVVVLALTASWLLTEPVRAGLSVVVDDRVVRTLTVTPGQSLAIAVTVGTVRVTGERGRADIRLDISRQAPSAEALARVPIALTETAEGPRLSLVQSGGGADAAIRTDVVVVAPADARLDAITIAEGRLSLRGVHGAVRASVARGAIEAHDVSGVLRLETTLGPIDVTRARLAADGLIRLRAFNGDVRLALDGALTNARVMALALNGTIQSSVPLTRKDGWGPRWGEASIGQPDRVLSIDVVTGAIRIDAPASR